MQCGNEHMLHLVSLLVQSGSVISEETHKNEKLNATSQELLQGDIGVSCTDSSHEAHCGVEGRVGLRREKEETFGQSSGVEDSR